jgi:hypothetical protein
MLLIVEDVQLISDRVSECPGLPMEINNKVWRWKDLEGFVMLGKDESLLYDDE